MLYYIAFKKIQSYFVLYLIKQYDTSSLSLSISLSLCVCVGGVYITSRQVINTYL